MSVNSAVRALSVTTLTGRENLGSAPMTLSVMKSSFFPWNTSRISSQAMSKVSSCMGRLLGLVQSMVASLDSLLTITVSLGLLPVDSTLVQVARAPQSITTASRRSTTAWIISSLDMFSLTEEPFRESRPSRSSSKDIIHPSLFCLDFE